MKKYKIVALFGKSGAGKDTIQNWIVSCINNTHKIISCTTRPKRDYEINGKDYHFITPLDFKNSVMLETSKFREWWYGTHEESLETNKLNIGVFNIEGIINLLKYEQLDILPIYIHTDDKSRLLRSLDREEDPDCSEICRRFLTDKKDFKNIPFNFETVYNSNDDFDYTTEQIVHIILEWLINNINKDN